MFSPDGRRILTASKDKTAKLWEAASGELVASFEHKDLNLARSIQSGRCPDLDG